jgi:hypothetical protein
VPVPALPVEVPAVPDGAPLKPVEPLKPLLVPPEDEAPLKPVPVLPEKLLLEPEKLELEPPALSEPPEAVDVLPLSPPPRGGVPSDEALQAASAETDRTSAETKVCDRISGLRNTRGRSARMAFALACSV